MCIIGVPVWLDWSGMRIFMQSLKPCPSRPPWLVFYPHKIWALEPPPEEGFCIKRYQKLEIIRANGKRCFWGPALTVVTSPPYTKI